MKLNFVKLLMALFCGAFILAGCGGKNEADVAKNFFNTIAQGKYDDAIAMVDLSDAKAEELTQIKGKLNMMFSEVKAQFDKSGGLSSIEAGEKTVSEGGNTAKVALTFKFGNGESKTETITLNKVNGEWKVQIF